MSAVVVSGQLDSEGLTGSLGPLYQVQSEGPFATSDPSGAYCLDFMSGVTPLSTHCFNLSFEAPETGAPINTDSFAFKLLFPTGTDRVVLRSVISALDEKVQSPHTPDVTITSPAAGGTLSGVVNISWTGSDLDGDALTYTVLYSRDNGTSFVPLAVNVTTTDLSVDSALLAGGQQAFVRVLASDGFNTTSIDSGTFQVENKPPIVLINTPVNNAVISSAEKLILSGAAQDPQDGELTAASSFSWQVDGAGSLGTGPEIIIPRGSLSTGTHVISLTAEDSGGQTATASVTVSVTQPPVAICKNVVVSANNQCQATASIDNGSYDPGGDPLTIAQNPAGPYALGATPVALTVTDELRVSDQCIGVVTVVDATPPRIGAVSVDPDVLWPPNHKMVPVTVAVSASDNCDAAPVCKITTISSNEPVNGLGDGDKAPDWEITGNLTANLRAERSGGGRGRVYTIVVQCTDPSKNSSTKSLTVTVPHDQGKR